MSTVKASYRELRAEYLNHKHRGTQMPPERLDALVGLAGDLLDCLGSSIPEWDETECLPMNEQAEDVRLVVRQVFLPHFVLC